MPCCCQKILNLCKAPVCGTLELRQAATAAESGVGNIYSLVLDYLETSVTFIQEQTEGENIKFDISKLNENYEYTGQVFDSAGEPVSITSGAIDYDCIKFRTILSLYPVTGTSVPPVIVVPPVLDIPDTVVVEAVVGGLQTVTGTTETVTGITDGSNTITSNAFIGVRVIVIRGNIPVPGIDPGDGSNFFTKLLASDFITLSDELTTGEIIRIQTIPQ